MSDGFELEAGGFRYAGWKSIRVTQSIESLTGSFDLEVSDRWDGEEAPWPILEEDECRVLLDGEVVIDGHVDKRDLSASKDSRTLSYSGRDRAALLVDNSVLLKQWTYKNVNVAEFAAAIAKPFGISVSVQAGLALPKWPKLVVSPGETAFEVIKRAAGDDGVLIVSDGAGGVLITRAQNERATPLVEGKNLLAASVSYDGTDRFYRYVIATQNSGSDTASGNATRVQAEATDENVRRTGRVLVMRPEKGYDAAAAKRRADYEMRMRAARADAVTATVRGWRQPNGKRWTVNKVTRVVAPRMIGVEADLLVSQVDYSIGDGGELTQLRLVRPDVYMPDPNARLKKAGSGGPLWPEITPNTKPSKVKR
jgi:prophage tail gpP-like protein